MPNGYKLIASLGKGVQLCTTALEEIALQFYNIGEEIARLEKVIFKQISNRVALFAEEVRLLADLIAEIDLCVSLANTTLKYDYTKPSFSSTNITNSNISGVGGCSSTSGITLCNSYHPILAKAIQNNIKLGVDGTSKVGIIFGSNMSGKSTMLRQMVILQVMAQIGSFVPATSMQTIIVDKILTRIGSGDDIYNEKSTFFTEMEELACIFKEATPNSLCIIDEIGRGTTHEEGLAIATSTIQSFIGDFNYQKAPYLLFATHYYSLSDALSVTAGTVSTVGIKMHHMQSDVSNDEITFTYKLLEGAPSQKISYGLYVAKKAGVPQHILKNANKILLQLI